MNVEVQNVPGGKIVSVEKGIDTDMKKSAEVLTASTTEEPSHQPDYPYLSGTRLWLVKYGYVSVPSMKIRAHTTL